MYCTIVSGPASTGLGDDAQFAYHRLRRKARALGTISSSFDTLALGVTAAYFAALRGQAPEAWTTLVLRTAVLVEHTRALRGIFALGAEERDALDFFEAIVRENADLVAPPELITAEAALSRC